LNTPADAARDEVGDAGRDAIARAGCLTRLTGPGAAMVTTAEEFPPTLGLRVSPAPGADAMSAAGAGAMSGATGAGADTAASTEAPGTGTAFGVAVEDWTDGSWPPGMGLTAAGVVDSCLGVPWASLPAAGVVDGCLGVPWASWDGVRAEAVCLAAEWSSRAAAGLVAACCVAVPPALTDGGSDRRSVCVAWS
jgi:hypothetical protein